jgi:hypothetical protein
MKSFNTESALRNASSPRFGWTNRLVYSGVLAVCIHRNFFAARSPVSSKWATSACFSASRISASTGAANSYPSSSACSTVSVFNS